HLIPQDDPLAKNVAASRKKIAFLLHPGQLALEAGHLLVPGRPGAPKATAPWASRFQWVSRVSRIPSFRATCAQLTPGWLACSTAPGLNSALNFLRFDMNTPQGLDRPYRKCP